MTTPPRPGSPARTAPRQVGNGGALLAVAVVAALSAAATLSACGGAAGAGGSATTTAPGVGDMPEAVATTRPGPLGTEEPLTTAPPATGSDEIQSGPVQIDVVVGVNSGPTRIEQVAVGSDVTLNITNPDSADEFHVHGIDLDRAVDAGVMATFNFTVTAAGTYEVESHASGQVLVVIEAV